MIQVLKLQVVIMRVIKDTKSKKNQFSNIIYRMIRLDELSMGLKNTPENVFEENNYYD